eukprot:9206903-Prorocentrum_lima.AAC.1
MTDAPFSRHYLRVPSCDHPPALSPLSANTEDGRQRLVGWATRPLDSQMQTARARSRQLHCRKSAFA